MSISTHRATWGSETIEISADWDQSSSPVWGVEGGHQVADFRHRVEMAMRAALEDCARAEGILGEPETDAMIREALATMVEAG